MIVLESENGNKAENCIKEKESDRLRKKQCIQEESSVYGCQLCSNSFHAKPCVCSGMHYKV